MLDRKIAQKQEEVKELQALAEGTSSGLSATGRVQSTQEADRTGRIVARYVDLERDIQWMLFEYCKKRNEIIDTIHQLKDRRFVELLHLKYVKYMRLEEVACTMKKTNGQPYSFRQIMRLHGEALRALEKVIEEYSE
jgi:hypothetical protein